MRRFKLAAIGGTVLALSVLTPTIANADIFGGDVVVLTQILAESIRQLIQIESLVKNGADSFSFLQEINSGIRNGLTVMEILNPKFNPGLYGNVSTVSNKPKTSPSLKASP
jgi:hypothetical protein